MTDRIWTVSQLNKRLLDEYWKDLGHDAMDSAVKYLVDIKRRRMILFSFQAHASAAREYLRETENFTGSENDLSDANASHIVGGIIVLKPDATIPLMSKTYYATALLGSCSLTENVGLRRAITYGDNVNSAMDIAKKVTAGFLDRSSPFISKYDMHVILPKKAFFRMAG